MKQSRILSFLFILLANFSISAQENTAINWIPFDQLDDSLHVKPKKVLVNFYADWCLYCKKMDRVAFKKSAIIQKINKEYYAVKMNAESKDTIVFDGAIFINKDQPTKRNSIHEIPLLLASRKNTPFSLPAIIFLDEEFKVRKRYFEYMSPKKLLSEL
ncbi:thioredoxin family protein [Aquimarina litoralis]|uniref:thioredoxin family protein n=1 Tax=Aquimarina litoralis TaxID=584605 RepID=UPI001C59AB56|nr:thioredoxin family protein [Aquimarina litoralis]MBW1295537.1 thioredoxin fold domain-containing protein [Aquimarina litoralis]